MATSNRPRISEEFVKRHQRERIMRAAFELIADRGYGATTVSDLVGGAAMARNTFYENFSSKEDCVQHAIKWASSRLVDRIAATAACAPEERFSASLSAILEFASDNPTEMHVYVVEAPHVDPDAFWATQDLLARQLDSLTEDAAEFVIGAVTVRLRAWFLAGADGDPRRFLSPLLLFIASHLESTIARPVFASEGAP